MARYTLELRDINVSDVFCYDYDFYDDELRCQFEEKFYDHYAFNEIGFETIDRFTHRLTSKLNMIMPYYTQLYKTELATNNIDFMLNKDLREERIINKNENNKGNTSGKDITNTTDSFKNSNIDNGLSSVGSGNGYITNSGDSENDVVGSTETTVEGTTETTEKETFISQGNIGITSSAELLQKWRSIIINIDQQIINECNNLFMGVF